MVFVLNNKFSEKAIFALEFVFFSFTTPSFGLLLLLLLLTHMPGKCDMTCVFVCCFRAFLLLSLVAHLTIKEKYFLLNFFVLSGFFLFFFFLFHSYRLAWCCLHNCSPRTRFVFFSTPPFSFLSFLTFLLLHQCFSCCKANVFYFLSKSFLFFFFGVILYLLFFFSSVCLVVFAGKTSTLSLKTIRKRPLGLWVENHLFPSNFR